MVLFECFNACKQILQCPAYETVSKSNMQVNDSPICIHNACTLFLRLSAIAENPSSENFLSALWNFFFLYENDIFYSTLCLYHQNFANALWHLLNVQNNKGSRNIRFYEFVDFPKSSIYCIRRFSEFVVIPNSSIFWIRRFFKWLYG